MSFIINSISKSFQKTLLLHDFSLSFPNYGFVSVLGKSGCGKSTLLHLIGTLEKPDTGKIIFDYEEIQNLKGNKQRDYLNQDISFVFQHYQLIEDQSIIFNASLPLIIAGEKEEFAFVRARKMLKDVGFDEEKQNQEVNACSGGEKQRVALVRSMINDPRVILADEPTGALDTQNSIMVMDILKKYSKNHLVIMVTHNKELAEEYSDRIVLLNDKLEVIHKTELNKQIEVKKKKRLKNNGRWINKFIDKNIKKRFKRNLITSLSTSLSLIFSFLLIGFIDGSSKVIEEQSIRQFDVVTSSISKETIKEIEGSSLKLVQNTRLEPVEIEEFIAMNDEFIYALNYDAFVPSYLSINIENINFESISYTPIYSFKSGLNESLLIEGRLAKDTLNEVVINKKTSKEILEKTGQNPLNLVINISYSREVVSYFDDDLLPYVTDYFEYDQKVKIVGIVDELSFLNNPKIFYSYKALDDYMDKYLMNNYSKQIESEYSFKSKVDQSSSNSELSSYSYKLFLKDYKEFKKIENFKSDLFTINNSTLEIKNALTSFISATTLGMELFLIIAILGSVFILAITSYSNYSQDTHQSAILLSLGAGREDIFSIYIFESLLIGTVSFIVSLMLSFILSPLINLILLKFTGFINLIQIPFKRFLNKRFFLPIVIFVITIFTCLISSYLPMALSKKTSISKELKEE